MQELYDLGVVSAGNIEPFHPRVRDRDDIAVLRDRVSGVVFLATTAHIDLAHYGDMKGCDYWNGGSRTQALALCATDDDRRAHQFTALVRDRDVLDVGCGAGGFMDRIRACARGVSGVEPQGPVRRELAALGYSMYAAATAAPAGSADVATLFHVFEHLTAPLAALRELMTVLRPGGRLVVEVPHARDVLLKLDAFRDFSLWSEHLVLHTKDSLRTYLASAGFDHIEIDGFQRYPFANHLGWLLDGKPGGQNRLAQFSDHGDAYIDLLRTSDQTDTLIGVATRP
jgi:SAM-dependent methyltransferase